MSGETEQDVSGWTTDTLRVHVETRIDALQALLDERAAAQSRQLDDLRALLQERYGTQTKAVDAAFQAQQLAMQTALTAAETAVSKALESAEKAVIKAETAADKRFESVNEFRQQLADQAATFMPRTEAEASLGRNTERIQELADRVNKSEGRGTGLIAGWGYLLAAVTALLAVYLAFRPI